MSKHVVCFHHDDLDGEASAAIVRAHNGAECVAVSYKDPFPFELVREYEEVWIVDFSLGEEGWGELATLMFRDDDPDIRITWIDHHGSAIKRAEKIPWVAGLPGVRIEGDKAACELTWGYIHSGKPCPLGITLIGDYDTWRFDEGERTRDFKVGLEAMVDTRPMESYEACWRALIEQTHSRVWTLMKDGMKIRHKRAITDAARVEKWSHDVAFEEDGWDGAPHTGIAMNTDRSGSDQFESVADEYELLLPYVFDGTQWTVGVYRGGLGNDIDCAQIAESFGGGGHPGAAGFQCERLPWEAQATTGGDQG